MYHVGTYRHIYNPTYDIEFSHDGVITKLDWGSKEKNERYKSQEVRDTVVREITFHIHFWDLMDSRVRGQVDGDLVVKVVGLLYEADFTNGNTLAVTIESKLGIPPSYRIVGRVQRSSVSWKPNIVAHSGLRFRP
jgi:hypothetical protein